MIRYLIRNILFAFLFILLPFAGGILSGSPQEISGVINTYARVSAIEAPDAVILSDVSGFNNGDTVLVIQMKGVSIDVSQTPQFGIENGYLGQPGDYGVGFYEFIIIEQVQGSPDNRLIFRNNLIGYDGYDIEGFVQVVKVPSFENATVTGELTCSPWDSISGTGGVLALIVQQNLVLNADIDLSGNGFRGGTVAAMDGAPLNDLNFYYPESSDIAGRKGESLASHYSGGLINISGFAKGIGALFNGGGGATGEFSGGGGGAGFGGGGNGARQSSTGYTISGQGGYPVSETDFAERVIMGGGGGGSGYGDGSSTATGGAAGGGIAFILADTLIGNGHAIRSDGDSLSTVAQGNAGAGGGGAAGSLVLSVKSYASSDIYLGASGGTGGHTEMSFGAGGVGGCCLVWINSPSVPPGVNIDVSGGQGGEFNYPSAGGSANAGTDGDIRTGLNLLLNGFLFNSIILESTETKTDSICYGQIPPGIKGTEAVGGLPPYTYRWEKKEDNETAWSLVPGSGNTTDLLPDIPETDTVQFRRVVTDSNASPMSDTSKAVTIIVQPAITGNLVGYDTIICAGQDPELLVPQNSGPGGGNGIYNYQWTDSTALNSWQLASGSSAGESYDPPALTASSWYSRIVVSGRCIDTSNVVFVEVLSPVTNNLIAEDQLICSDNLFEDLTGTVPLDGDGLYRYEWISSTDQNNWLPAEGTNDTRDYDPDEDSPDFPGDKYFKRIVRSGYLDCCSDTSAGVTLTSLPVISGNIISAAQTVCELETPSAIIGDIPSGGDGADYAYQWQDSSRLSSWAVIDGADQKDYQPPALTDTTWYRRIVLSSVCDDTSNVSVLNVNPAVTDNEISTLSGDVDTVICSGQIPLQLKGMVPSGGDNTYFYEWQFSTDQVTWNAAPGTSDQLDYSPPSLTEDTWFRRAVLSGECAVESNTVKITVLPLISDNTVESDQMVCFNTQAGLITGTDPSGGNGSYTYLWEQSADNISWVPAEGTNTTRDYQPGVLSSETHYRRLVFSGLSSCCQDISNTVTMGIHPLPTGFIISALDTSCAGSPLNVSLSLTGAGPWSVVLNDGTTDLQPFTATDANYDYTVSPTYDSYYSLVSLTDANSCQATSMSGSRQAVVYEVPTAYAGDDDDVCGPEYDLQAGPSTGDGRWFDPEGVIGSAENMSSATNTINIGSNYGTHTFWWKETNWQCVDSASVDISFWEQPAQAYAGEDQQLEPYRFEYQLQADAPAVGSGSWSVIEPSGPSFDNPDDYATWVRDLAYGENIFLWTVKNGEGNGVCTSTDQLSLYVSMVFIPDGFSPNGDGINDIFEIGGDENTTNELIITNMSGAVVYRATNYMSNRDEVVGWQGRDLDGKPLPDGTYYYYLNIKSPVNERHSGYIVIKR